MPDESEKVGEKMEEDEEMKKEGKNTEEEKESENPEEKEMKKKKKERGKGKEKEELGEDGGGGGGFEIIAIKEKHGQLRKAVPVMPMPLAVLLCIVNVVLPGIGTLVSSFVVFCGGKSEYESKGKAFGLNVVAAILQLLTLPIIVGWIWSIVWGVTFVTSAMSKEESSKVGVQEVPGPEHV